jgi:hypothetical protein
VLPAVAADPPREVTAAPAVSAAGSGEQAHGRAPVPPQQAPSEVQPTPVAAHPGDDDSKPASVAAAEPRSNPADLDARIAALERQIAGDEESLKALLSEVPAPGAPELATRPEFREIALRLPKLQAELRTLQEQRARRTEP